MSDTAFVGKPCEVSAIRALDANEAEDGHGPLLLSFFCAGTPSQAATESLLETLGVAPTEELSGLTYRGHGWPGEFTATREDSTSVGTSYDESWGRHLGPTVQWRCKICPDGIGESADIAAADFWRADERGYPDFAEGAGVSALIARTARGFDTVTAAVEAGVIRVVPMDIEALASVQPLQRDRRETLVGRLIGTRVAGTKPPRYHGFALVRLALPRLRRTYRVAKGSFRRRRSLQSD